jgi:tRNA-dihydrouridine synthase C
MLDPDIPALILAPMQGVTDAPMRALQGELGAFTFAVSEFARVSQEAVPKRVFRRHVPELEAGAKTPTGLPVQVQLLGGDPDLMARSAVNACEAGATAIDINFGCPAPTVNRNDGGATLLKYPARIRDIVRAIREAIPLSVPVSAKLRLGWDSLDAIYENAQMAAEGGASWITIHGRTRVAGYAPPAYWNPIGQVREQVGIPVVANGDIWTLDEFHRCQDETGCCHFMLGRCAMADPRLSHQIARELGLLSSLSPASSDSLAPLFPAPAEERETIKEREEMEETSTPCDWIPRLQRLMHWMRFYGGIPDGPTLQRLKQWLRMASHHDGFDGFEQVKRAETIAELFAILAAMAFTLEFTIESRTAVSTASDRGD